MKIHSGVLCLFLQMIRRQNKSDGYKYNPAVLLIVKIIGVSERVSSHADENS